MRRDIENINAAFREEISVIYLRLTEAFEHNVRKLDRQWDENVFRQLQSRYEEELKRELAQLAEKFIGQHGDGIHNDTLRRDFSAQIAYTLTEFRLRINSM